jgi:hypothetical protein
MLPPCALATLSLLATAPFNASVAFGVLTAPLQSPCALGNTTSALSDALGSLFSPLTPNATRPLKNSTSFYSYFILIGDYVGDAPLLLPASVALVFSPAGASITAVPSFPPALAIINATDAPYSAVVAPGGPSTARITCPPGGPSPCAVLAAGSYGFVLDGLAISGCGGGCGSAVHVRGAPYAVGGEVAGCVITDSPARAVWTEACSGIVVHGNAIARSGAHTIDMDAYSSNIVVFNNTVSHSAQEAVFIEQGAENVVVVDNDLGPANAHGVGIYNNAFPKPTSNHVIARNRVWGSTGCGISTGSGPHHTGAEAVGVIVAGNTLWANNGTGLRTNGDQAGTLFVANSDGDGVAAGAVGGGVGAKNVSFADPQDRVRVASAARWRGEPKATPVIPCGTVLRGNGTWVNSDESDYFVTVNSSGPFTLVAEGWGVDPSSWACDPQVVRVACSVKCSCRPCPPNLNPPPRSPADCVVRARRARELCAGGARIWRRRFV